MADSGIARQLRERCATPLEYYECGRVIVWHDPDGEFKEDGGVCESITWSFPYINNLKNVQNKRWG